MSSPQRLWTDRVGALGPGRRRGALQIASGTVWLLFVIPALVDNISARVSPSLHVLAVAGAAVFVADYVGIISCWNGDFWPRYPWARPAMFGALLAIGLLLTLTEPVEWGFLFIYCAACAALIAMSSLGFWLVALCVSLAIGSTLIAGEPLGAALAYGGATTGIGLMMLLVGDLRVRNAELTRARAELARLAVARERERFARDLHDLLGHTLSVIAIKAELARRLAPADPQRAAVEIADVETIARAALNDVREAVSGYRQPTLDGELAGARMALGAAGIHVDVVRAEIAVDPSVEAVLAWALREGATNVIRHSQARRCLLRVIATPGGAGVEVLDDGTPGASASANGNAGHGLEGLRERVGGINGIVSAGPRAGGGYRLAVEVPAVGGVKWSPAQIR